MAGKGTGPGAAQALAASVSFADGAAPYAARLVFRDVRRAPRPYLDARRKDAQGRIILAARRAPAGVSTAILASSRAPADPLLVPDGAKSALAFRFPDSAVAALSQLDPREAAAVEFVFAGPGGRDSVRTLLFEVGDFAAGHAFLAAGL